MFLHRWLSARLTRGNGTHTRRPSFRPGCERLEDRTAPAVLSLAPAHIYDLNGGLADRLGGPALAADGGTLHAGRYVFGPNQGLRLNGALADTNTYSVVARFEIDALNPAFKKILDFAGRTSDNGLYIAGSRLRLYPGGEGVTNVVPNTDLVLTLTRDGVANVTKVYFNGNLEATYTGGVAAVAASPLNRLTFFEDDGTSEAVGGSVDYLAVFDGVLTAADAVVLGTSVLAVRADLPTVNVPEGRAASATGTWSDNGIEIATLAASVGAVHRAADGSWSWSGANVPNGQRVTITAADGDGSAAAVDFTVNVTNVAPEVTAAAGSVTVTEGGSATLTGTWTDAGGDPVTLNASIGVVTQNADGTWSWSAATADGPDDSRSVIITATDEDGDSGSVAFDLIVENAAPALAADAGSVEVPPGGVVAMTGTWSDPGDDDVTLTASLGSVIRNADGSWNWSYTAVVGVPSAVTITATDSDGAAASTSFDLVFNEAPLTVAADAATVAVTEGAVAGLGGTWSGTDVTLSASVGSVVRNDDGTWSWSLATANGPGDSSDVVITATDGRSSVTAGFRLEIGNAAPEFLRLTNSHATLARGAGGRRVTLEGAFSDAGLSDTHRVRVRWGDGSAETVRPDQLARTLRAGHRYDHGGVYTISVTLIDDDGASVTQTTRALVRGVGRIDGVYYVVTANHVAELTFERVREGRRTVFEVELRLTDRDGRTEVFTFRNGAGIDALLAALGRDRFRFHRCDWADR